VTNISRVAAGAAAALALALAAGTVITALPAAARPAAAAQPALASASPGGPVVLRVAGPARPAAGSVQPAVGSVASLNSAGYAVSRGHTRFRLVRATFFVPYLNCALSKGTYSSDWIGLGGFVGKSDSVEQDGIEANCSRSGSATYRAWYEMYPRKQHTSGIRIKGGDSVTASVYYDAADVTFSLAVTNNTTGGHFLAKAKCPDHTTCPRYSAELISSAPATGKAGHLTIKPLADYGAVSFAGIAITDRSGQHSGITSAFWGTTRILQTEGSTPFRLIARPTQVQGDTFDNYWSREN
jgi:hypothetical protein